MFTQRALNKYIEGFIADLTKQGYAPTKVVLFGSYAYGKPSETSDIDLAVWDNLFTGCGSIDIVPIVSIVSKYPQLELHPFNAQEENDPFAEEILKKGKLIV